MVGERSNNAARMRGVERERGVGRARESGESVRELRGREEGGRRPGTRVKR